MIRVTVRASGSLVAMFYEEFEDLEDVKKYEARWRRIAEEEKVEIQIERSEDDFPSTL